MNLDRNLKCCIFQLYILDNYQPPYIYSLNVNICNRRILKFGPESIPGDIRYTCKAVAYSLGVYDREGNN